MKKGIAFFVIFAVVMSGLLYVGQKSLGTGSGNAQETPPIVVTKETKDINLNMFLELYKSGSFEKIQVEGLNKLLGYQFLSGEETTRWMSRGQPGEVRVYRVYQTSKPLDSSLTELGLSLTGATKIDIDNNEGGFWSDLGAQAVSLLLFFVLLIVLMRFLGPKGGGFPFSISVGKLKTKADVKTKFSDIAGMEEAKFELQELVDFLKNPQKYQKVGARPPRGVLLHGAPGGGKTLLAKAVAGEANVPFFSVSGSEFMEMLVGMGAAKVRELFNKAKTAAPAIIFIDEIDAIGKRRGSGYTGGHQEQEQTLNQILTEMDGFDTKTNVIVVAATNRPDVLDPALLRSGRFDRKVFVSRPTLEERELIIKYYLRNKKIDADVQIDSLAKRTTGLVGADIENIVNEASLKIAREARTVLKRSDFEYALEKTIMGPEKKIKSIKEQERKIIAYHELGHAITGHFLEHADPIEKISIVSRGMALGVTWMMPEEDKYLYSKAKFLDEMVTLLGGRAIEEIVFGKEHITTGASNDLERVTKLATDMVTKYGMDEEIGLVQYKQAEAGEMDMYRPYAEQTAQQIDLKIRSLVSASYERSKQLLTQYLELIHTMAQVLLEKEYLTKEEFEELIAHPESASDMINQAVEHKKQEASIEKSDDIEVIEKKVQKSTKKVKRS